MSKYTKYLTICKKCREKAGGEGTLRQNGYSIISKNGKCNVGTCDGEVENTVMTSEEYDILTEIDDSVKFIESMIKLKEDDIIEFNLKMSQFRANSKQVEQSSVPHCPTCGSLNIEKISTGKKIFGGAMFGLFSSDVRNTMHCKNCGAKW